MKRRKALKKAFLKVNPNNSEIQGIENIILEMNNLDSSTDTTDLENQIDQLVYQL